MTLTMQVECNDVQLVLVFDFFWRRCPWRFLEYDVDPVLLEFQRAIVLIPLNLGQRLPEETPDLWVVL